MVVKRNWKRNAYDKEHGQHELIVGIYDGKRRHVGKQDHQLGRDYVHQDGPDKEPLLALEARPTRRAVIFYSKGRLNDGGISAGRTTEMKTPAEEVRKRWAVYPQLISSQSGRLPRV